MKKIVFLIMISMFPLSSFAALGPEGMKTRNIYQMKEMRQLFIDTNTQEPFVVESFKMKSYYLFLFELVTAEAKIVSVKTGERKNLSYSAKELTKPGPQTGIISLEEGKEYFMRINCNGSKCKPPFYKFFNYSQDEFEGKIDEYYYNK